MSNKREKSSDTEMTFFEHIEALRPHLVRGVLALVVVMIAAFIGKKFVIDWVLMGPQSPDFPTNRWLCDFSYWVFGDNRICINQVKINMVNTALAGQFNLHMQVAFATAIAVAVPYLLWELWRFVLPALTPRERQKSRMFVLYVSLCFFTGLAFADLQSLRVSQIEKNNEGKRYIRKARQKTEVESLIPLHPIAEQILSLYTKEESKGDYKIFPDTMSKGKLLTHLKAVGWACGIRTPLTWHVGRHSFGTLTLEAGIPIESIAKMMGHSSIASTQIYAQITDQKIARDMERVM